MKDHARREALLDWLVGRYPVGASILQVEPSGKIVQEQPGISGYGAAAESVAQALGHRHNITERIGGAKIRCMPRISDNSRYQ